MDIKSVFDVLDSLSLFPSVLNSIISEYCKEIGWETKCFKVLDVGGRGPDGLIGYQQRLYVCDSLMDQLTLYDKNGKIIKRTTAFEWPFGIDIDEKSASLFIAGRHKIIVLNDQLEQISSWRIPSMGIPVYPPRGIKVYDNIVYLTLYDVKTVFVCNAQDGTLLEQWDNEQFKDPRGITVNEQKVYLCDRLSHCVQILTRGKGMYINHWGTQGTELGQLFHPVSISYQKVDEIFYIGDERSFQLFTKEGTCIQRIESGFSYVYGVSIMDNHLYVCDSYNERIQIFKRSSAN